jgi:hypothetical protein
MKLKTKKGIAPKSILKAAPKKTAVKKAAPAKKSVAKAVLKKITPIEKALTTRHFISVMEGNIMIENFQIQKSANKLSSKHFSVGREFDISLFEVILKIKGVKKIRFTNAINEKNEHTLVVTPVNAKGNDMYLPASSNPNIINPKTNSFMAKSTDAPPEDGMGDMGDQCTNPDYKKTNP